MQVAQMYVNGREQDYCRFQQFDFIHAMQTVELVKPTMDLRVEFLTMAKEYLCFGDNRYVEAIENFKEYMTKARKFCRRPRPARRFCSFGYLLAFAERFAIARLQQIAS